jgi:3-hydroxybutyrate dehydrogenase
MKNLENLVVAITGGSSGIGLESARLFAAAGARVALLARDPGKLTAAADSLGTSPAGVLPLSLDVTEEAAVEKTFSEIAGKLGPVDILINNAGTGFATDLSACSLADYRRIFETNVTGAFLCTRAVLPAMKERKGGHIINVSSIVGKVANPNAPLYCASKHALNGYTSGLQQQVAAEKIRVSLVSPASTDTAYWDGRPVDRSKFLAPAEVAAVIFFIASQPDGVLITDVDLTALR